MRIVEFEGTPEEFALVKHHFNTAAIVKSAVEPELPESELVSDPKAESSHADLVEVVVDTLTRRPLPPTMVQVFQALLKTEKGLSSKQLAKLLDLTTAQFSGVMGAFGRRISYTEGWTDDLALADVY